MCESTCLITRKCPPCSPGCFNPPSLMVSIGQTLFCCQNNHQVMINFAKLMDSISSGFNPFVIQLFRSRSMLQMTNTCQGTSNSDTCAIGQSDPRSEAGAEHAAGLVSRWLCCSLGFKSCTEYRFKKNH